ncbi:transposase [Candidatus Collierbacteria bacterium]|nr:transposase [Candidatus Collierbacteria bacterium]
MPGRIVPLVTDSYYHVFNRGVAKGATFTSDHEYRRAISTLSYYCHLEKPYSLSRLYRFDPERQNKILHSIKEGNKLVEVPCFCLMPNHFHLLLRQNVDGGISKYLSNFQNSYTRFFNTVHKRDGPLFLSRFKAVEIETEEQLLHVSRYIHLNPYVGSVVQSLDNLRGYPWSSLQEYTGGVKNNFVNTDIVQSMFSSKDSYIKFVFDEAEYRRTLKRSEKLLLDFG